MPASIYPTDARQWAALIAALVPVFVWAVSGLIRGAVMWNQRREGEWKRLHELAAILYNKDGESGLWSQVLAVEELKRLRTRRKEVLELAHAAAIQFSSLPQTPETKGLINKLRDFTSV